MYRSTVCATCVHAASTDPYIDQIYVLTSIIIIYLKKKGWNNYCNAN